MADGYRVGSDRVFDIKPAGQVVTGVGGAFSLRSRAALADRRHVAYAHAVYCYVHAYSVHVGALRRLRLVIGRLVPRTSLHALDIVENTGR